MSFEIRQATRVGIKPLVGMYGRSGSGKTMSALLLARGLAGPDGKITVCDSENRRGSIFADIIPGGYQVIDIEPPFSPMRYEEAIVTAEKCSDVVIVDSMSQEWSGEGGVLDWAEDELQKMGGGDNNKMRSWIKPKIAHKMMIQRLLRCKCALICCLRGEEKTHMDKKGAKNVVVTDEFSSPLFDQRFIFELLLNFETVSRDGKGGFVIPRKITHPSIAAILPAENEQIGIKHGEALARWCANAGGVGTQSKPPGPPPDELKCLKAELWAIAKPVRGHDATSLERFLIDECILGDTETLADLGVDRIKVVITKTKAKIEQLAEGVAP